VHLVIMKHSDTIVGHPEVGTRSGPAPIRLGDADRIKSSSPRRGRCQAGPIQKKRLKCL
jgi:hypothetical protein